VDQSFAQAATILPMPRGNFALDVVYDTATDRIWVATNKGPAVSSDGGATWRSFYNTSSFRDDSVSCSAIAVRRNLIVVATAAIQTINEKDITVGTGIHISTNGGNNWIHYAQPKDDPNDTIIIYGKSHLKTLPVTVDEQNVTYGIGIQNTTDPATPVLWITSFAGGTRKSTDLGKTWSKVVLPPTDLSSIDTSHEYHFGVTPVPSPKFIGTDEAHLNHEGFSVLVENDSTVWIGTAGGINRSTDGGLQWTKFTAQNTPPITGNWVLDIKYRGPGEIWAATAKTFATGEKNGISYTTDDGATWNVTSELLTDTSSSGTARVSKIAFLKNLIYAANNDGIWRSSDNGVTWITPSIIFNRSTRDIITQKGVYSIGSNGSTVFVGTFDGLVSIKDDPDAESPLSGSWKFYEFAQPVSTADDQTYAYPNPFQPSQEETRIRFLVEGQQNVTIEILDFQMRLVRTILRDAPRTGSVGSEFKELWDGRDNYGHRVPNGTYPYKVTVGSKTYWGKIVVLR